MKNKLYWLFTAILIGVTLSSYAQTAADPPAGTASGTFPANLPNSTKAWIRGGNLNAGNGGSDNIFGTGYNNPIYTITNNVFRMKLNSTYIPPNQYTINGFTFAQGVNKSGNLLISTNNLSSIYTAKGAFSMLHLNGGSTTNGTSFVQEGGWRTWMDVGVTFTSNQDLAYIGHRQIGTGTDKTELVINWSDNAFGPAGSDVCTFRFTAGTGSGNNDLNGDALGGREIMRLRGDGNVGIGPRFSSTNNEPMSLLHMNSENNTDAWLQISNQGVQPATYTGNDGLRLGIFGDPVTLQNGNAFLYNQEDRHLIFSTNHSTPTAINTTQERMRITSAGAPTNLPLSGYGSYNPSALPADNTRIGISLLPGSPVTRPLSLLHLGLNAGTITPALGTDGWRPWMELGMFVSSGSDHVFMGLKPRASVPVLFDEYDAVIGWGDNQPGSAPSGTGPDNLRFIFTANPNGPGATAPATNTNGIEAMRISPTATSVFVGIGDDAGTNNLYSGPGFQPGNTLEINSTVNGAATANSGGGTGFSGLRFTDLNSTSTPYLVNPSAGVLSVDANGDVILVPGGTGGGQFFTCGTSNPADQLPSDSWWELNNHNFVFSGNGAGSLVNNVGIGTGCTPGAKLEILQLSTFSGAIAERITNSSVDGLGMDMIVNGAGTSASHTGVQVLVQGASNNNTGISSTAFGGTTSNGGVFKGISASSSNNGVIGSANGSAAGVTNYGGRFFASSNPSGTINYGIYAESLPIIPGSSFAARFEGNILFNGNLSGVNNVQLVSDQMFKTNINPIVNATQFIESLQPKTFYFDTLNQYGIYFSSAKQYGLVAQDVQQVLPELVSETVRPALLDSSGQTIYPGVTYKSLNYNAFIAILIKGMQEQNAKIDSLQNQINSCCSSNTRHASPDNLNQTDVHLSDVESIVLNQNVPNPFAEETTISYNLPQNVQKAQILFYDAQGKLIKAVELTSRGKGQLNVFADDLSNGIYTYALVADGQVADTKRMVKTK